MVANNDLPVYIPVTWDDILHGWVTGISLDSITKLPYTCYQKPGKGRMKGVIPGGVEYTKKGDTYRCERVRLPKYSKV
jgi:hypothetical protein